MASVLNTVALSLVTYTYNDASLCHALLEHMRSWSVQPKEIIVVDDCSDVPFSTSRSDVTVIRLAENSGPTGAKRAGLAAAKYPLILSLDCDIRIPDHWISQALPLIRNPRAGLVSSHVLCTGGSDDVSRYVDRRYSFRPAPGVVPFIPGCVFLMRRDVYHKTGGLQGHASRINDDVYLCRVLRLNEYDLLVAEDLEARQERTMTLVACIRRAFTWDMPYFSRTMAEGKDFSELLITFIVGHKGKMENTPEEEKHLHYFDLLYLLYGCMSLAGQFQESHASAVWRSFAGLLQAYPTLWASLNFDMPRFYEDFDFSAAAAQSKVFEGIEPFFNHVFTPEICCYLEDFLQKNRLSESESTHFSLYEKRGGEVL